MTQREELNADQKKLTWLLGLEKETLVDMAHQQSKIIEKLQKADKEQAVPQWIPVSERLPDEDAVVVGKSDAPIEYCDYAVFNFFNGIFHLNTDGLEASNYDGGAVIKCEFVVVEWTPLPSAPEQNK